MKQFTIPVYLGISPEMILGFASCVWIKSLTRSIGAVAVFAIEPETPPAAKSLKKPSGSCLYYARLVERERKIESKPFEQSERKKKKKKRSDRFRMMMMFFFSPAISRTPRKPQLSGERKRTRREEKRRRSLSLFRSISFQRGEIFSRRAHTFNHLLAALKRRCVLNNLIALLRKARGSERAATFLSRFDRRFRVQEYTFRPNVHISSSSRFTSRVIAHIHVPRDINHIWIFSKTTLECTHHFFLTVRGELRGRSLRPRHLHRRHNSSSTLFTRRLRFQVALERLLVKGFRKRHLSRKCLVVLY